MTYNINKPNQFQGVPYVLKPLHFGDDRMSDDIFYAVVTVLVDLQGLNNVKLYIKRHKRK